MNVLQIIDKLKQLLEIIKMLSAEQEITKELAEHLQRRSANKQFLLSKGIEILNREFIEISQIDEGVIDDEVQDTYYLIKGELNLHGYTEVRFLGSGKFGCVVLAKLQGSNIRHAIKGIKVRNMQGDIMVNSKKLCDNEIKILNQCSGSSYTLNLIKVLEGKQFCYLVLNECKGTLENLLDQQGGRLSELSTIKYSKDIAEGLNHIHNQGFLMDDLKLDNILIDYNNNAVVGDLGLGNRIQSKVSCAENNYMGNLLYQAPETQDHYRDEYAARNIVVNQKPGKKSEAFSLGYIIYGLLFGTNSVVQKMFTKNVPLQFPDTFNSLTYKNVLERLILGLTQFNPKDRLRIDDVFLMLKGLVSLIFDFEAKLNERFIITNEILKFINQNQIEMIQLSRDCFFPIVINENQIIPQSNQQNSQQIKVDQLSNQLQQLEQQIKQLKQTISFKDIDIQKLENQLKIERNQNNDLKIKLENSLKQLIPQNQPAQMNNFVSQQKPNQMQNLQSMQNPFHLQKDKDQNKKALKPGYYCVIYACYKPNYLKQI